MRPDSWNFPLLLHIVGAAVMFGAVAAAVVSTLAADRVAEPDFMRRLAFRSLLFVGLPAYIVMRVGAQWLYSKGYDELEEDPAWLSIGFIIADLGLLIFLIALVLTGIASWKRKSGLGKAAGLLGALLLVAMVVAVWAMGAKPD
jgi:cytosine/uracil/thiamine/allantoin permease